MSAQYAAMEDVFVQIGKGDKDDPVYKMNSAEKDCLDTFMMARNNGMLWGKCDVDRKSHRPKIYDELGRPIISGDGIIPQIERFATKMVFTRLTPNYFNNALAIMRSKSERATGNTLKQRHLGWVIGNDYKN